MPVKEGEVLKCEICKKPLEENILWKIERYEKILPQFQCPSCGKPIILEFQPSSDRWTLIKPCTCVLNLTPEILEDKTPKWKKKIYAYCDDCFREAFANIYFADLEERL